MTESLPCPEPAELEALARGTVATEKHDRHAEHIDACTRCQEALEKLAQHTVVSLAAAAATDDGSTTTGHVSAQPVQNSLENEPALRDVMQRLKHGRGSLDDPIEETSVLADEPLSYLDPTDAPGRIGRLGSYEVTEVIGHGGMGLVLKAMDPSLNRFVAIKLLAPQLATSAAARKRFAREARAAAAVSHEHVVAIHGVDEHRGLPYLVMTYVPGESLQQRVGRLGSLELIPILRIGMQTAAGLAAAHAQGLTHRDVKPANILLEDGVDRVKITDFGLARAVDDAQITQSGVVAGTPEYMSPEQAAGGPADQRSDLFSFGSVLYTMCIGRPPFRADTCLAVLRQVCDAPPSYITEVHPETPIWLIAIIDKLLAKDPADRFQSAAEVADLLGQCLAHAQQPRATPLPRLAKELGRAHARRGSSKNTSQRWIAVAAAFLFLFGGIGLTDATGLTNVHGLVAHVVVRLTIPRGVLVIEVGDPNVRVTVDGDDVMIDGTGMGQIVLRPGRHQVQAVKDGAIVSSEIVSIARGDKQVLRVHLEPKGSTSGDRSDPSVPLSVLRLDPELVDGIHAKIIRAVPLTKDCSVLYYKPDWNFGTVDNIALMTNGVRTLIDWPPLSAEDLRASHRFVLALYSRNTRCDISASSILLYDLRGDWSEITSWNAQPAYASEISARYDFVPANGWKLFDVTPLVRARSTQSAWHGMMLRFETEHLGTTEPHCSGYQFVSREGEGEWAMRKPVLMVLESRDPSP